MSTKTPTRKARPVYRMARLDRGDLYEAARGFVIREGDTVFLAHVSHPADHRADYNAASLFPHRTNWSREETEHGDLGSDNTGTYTAIGRGVVVTAPGPGWADGEMYAESETWDWLGSHAFVEPYYSLRVRMDDSAPDTFEVVDLNPGSLYRPRLKPARIDRAGKCAEMNHVFSMKISKHQHARLREAPVPGVLAAVGIQRFGVADAVRFAVISYLAQPTNPLPSAIQSGDVWLQVNLPLYLHVQLEERAATEQASKASLVRAAIDLFLPPAQGEAVAGPTPPVRLNAAMVRKRHDAARF